MQYQISKGLTDSNEIGDDEELGVALEDFSDLHEVRVAETSYLPEDLDFKEAVLYF